MTFARTLRRAATALRDAPVLFVPALALALLWAPGAAVRPVAPGWANLLTLVAALVTLLVGPVVVAGAVGLADAALDGGDARLGSFLAAARRGSLPTLGVSVGLGAVAAAVAVLVGLLGVVAVFSAYPGGAAPPSDAAASDTSAFVLLLLAVAAALVLAALAVALFVHLSPHAAVVDGHGVLGCVPRSARAVLAGGTATVGYAVVLLALAVLLGATAVLVPAAAPGPAPVGVAVAGCALVALWTLCGGALVALSTAQYRAATRPEPKAASARLRSDT